MKTIKPSKFCATGDKQPVVVFADGVTDDTEAIQKIVNGESYGVTQDGRNISHFPWKVFISKCVISKGERK